MQARSGILASHLNSQKLLKQFSDELVKSLLEAVHIYSRLAVTVLLLSWTTFILDVNSKPKKLFNQIANKPEHCLHYLLPTVIVSFIKYIGKGLIILTGLFRVKLS